MASRSSVLHRRGLLARSSGPSCFICLCGALQLARKGMKRLISPRYTSICLVLLAPGKVCCLGALCILLQPFENGEGLRRGGSFVDIDVCYWPVPSTPLSIKLGRWCFWILVLAHKVWASSHGVEAIEQAIAELKAAAVESLFRSYPLHILSLRAVQMSRPGRAALGDIPSFAFGPNWDKETW